jgi:hypothetical protein
MGHSIANWIAPSLENLCIEINAKNISISFIFENDFERLNDEQYLLRQRGKSLGKA